MIGHLAGFFGAALCIASICAIGDVLARRLRAGEPNDARPARPSLGWAFLLGSAAVGLVLQIPLAIDGQITHRSFALVGIVGLAALAWTIASWWRNASPPRDIPWGWLGELPMLGRLFAVVALPAAVVYCCRTDLTGYDARSIYALKARVLYDTGTLHGEDFQDIQRVHFNPAYPLLMPLVEAQVYWTQGSYARPSLKLLFLCFTLSLASVYAGQMRRYGARGLAAILALMLLLTPISLECFEGAALSGSADLPLAALILAGVLELSRWNPAARLAAGRLCRAAARRGRMHESRRDRVDCRVYCRPGRSVATTANVADSPRNDDSRRRAGLLALIVAVRQSVLHQLPNSPYYPSYFAALDWRWIKQLGDRPVVVLQYGLAEIVRFKFWNLMWPCILASLVLLRRSRLPAEVWFWRLTAFAGICASLFALVITPLHLEYELRTSFSRLMLHAFPLAVLIMAEQMAASGFSGQLSETVRADEPTNEPAEENAVEEMARAA